MQMHAQPDIEAEEQQDDCQREDSTVMHGSPTLPFVETEAKQERRGCQSKSRAPSLGPASKIGHEQDESYGPLLTAKRGASSCCKWVVGEGEGRGELTGVRLEEGESCELLMPNWAQIRHHSTVSAVCFGVPQAVVVDRRSTLQYRYSCDLCTVKCRQVIVQKSYIDVVAQRLLLPRHTIRQMHASTRKHCMLVFIGRTWHGPTPRQHSLQYAIKCEQNKFTYCQANNLTVALKIWRVVSTRQVYSQPALP